MRVSLADQIEFAAIIRDSFEGLIERGAQSTNGMSMETKLDRAEAILLTLKVYELNEADFSAYLAKQGKE